MVVLLLCWSLPLNERPHLRPSTTDDVGNSKPFCRSVNLLAHAAPLLTWESGISIFMDSSTALALLASAFLGTAVVIANVGLRYLDPARGALVSIPSTTLFFGVLALFLFRGEGWNATAFAIFAAVGLIFPALVTFLNFASNRLTAPTVAGTISSTTPLFAVLGAILFLSEPLTPAAAAGTTAIVLGVVALTARGSGPPRSWAAWVILLPLAGASIRGGAQAAV